MDLLEYTGSDNTTFRGRSDTSAMDDGLHLIGTAGSGLETVCGYGISCAPSRVVEGAAPTCRMCIDLVEELFGRYTKKQVKGWRGKKTLIDNNLNKG